MKTPGLNPIPETTPLAPEGATKETKTRLSRFTGSIRAFAPLGLCVNSAILVLKPRLLRVALLALALGLVPGLEAPCLHAQEPPTYYVNVANANPVFPYTSWATVATNIQDAINAGTTAGRLVLVTNGVYQTGTVEANGANRVALTNAVLRSVNGPAATIIDGGGTVRCVYLGANAVLCGFTVRNGSSGGGGGVGGVAAVTSGVVTNCVVTGNSGFGGGGVSGGTLYNCVVAGNTCYGQGGGVSGATLYNCTLTDNRACGFLSISGQGGGAANSVLYDCVLSGNWADGWGWFGSTRGGGGAYASTLYNCRLTENSTSGRGGGAADCTLYNCRLSGNWAESAGGGAFGSTLYNCTLTGNSALRGALRGGGGACDSTLYNSIVYFNQGGNWDRGSLQYCCTTPLPPGPGNISEAPQLASTSHLSATSPCLRAGSKEWATGRDLDGEPWGDPPAIGADQVWPGQSVGPLTLQITAEFTEVAPGFPVSFTAHNAGSILRSVWDFGDGTLATNQPSISHAWRASGEFTVRLTGYNDTHPEGVSSSVQVKVIEAVHYVNVANATPVFPYTSWATAATNLQDAVSAGSVIGRLVLVTNGVYRTGTVEVDARYHRVALTNTVLRSVNGPELTAIVGEAGVQGVYLEAKAVLSGFTVRNSSEVGVFAAAAFSVITNCVLTGNGVGADGGTLYNCRLTGNRGAGAWRGAYGNSLYNCTLTGNGDGGANGSILYNCTLTGNHRGGANDSALYNCTLTGNSGGGANGGTLQNCIVYFNQGGNWRARPDPEEGESTSLEDCRTTPLPPGPGNIEADPGFVDAAAGDFHLRLDSPCIDAGTDLAWLLATDLLGLPRPLDGNGDGVARFDMGAYEFVLLTLRFAPDGRLGPDGFHFTVLGEPGKSVRVERSRDLRLWEAVTTVPLPATGQALLDPAALAERMLFYRAVEGP